MDTFGSVIGTVVIAWWGEGHPGDDGWWWVARLLVGLVWLVAVLFLVRWIVFGRRHWGGPSGTERARAILAERYARGEIDAAEYHQRLDQLR